MKFVKKLVMLITVLVMVFTCMIPAVMADGTDGTITLTNAAIGKEYQAYKILDATYSGEMIAYTTTQYNLFSAAGSPWAVQDTPDADGNYSVTQAEGAGMDDISTWITANLSSFTAINPTAGVGTDSKTATDDTVSWSNLPYGYYYITSGLGAVVTVNSVMPNPVVIDKNTTNPSSVVKTSDSATAQIGDTVLFTVTFTATNYITETANDEVSTQQVTVYTVTDTASGFDYLVDTMYPVTVQVGSNEAFSVEVTPTQQTAAADGTMAFSIPWADENGNPLYQYSEDVTVTYYGTVNEFAYDGNAVNTVAISNNTDTNTLTASTETGTYSLTINKTDDKGNALTGASFVLHRNANEDAEVSLIDITDSVANKAQATRYFRVAEAGETGITTIDLTEGSDSSAVIYGLDGADTYYIDETKAPRGYTKLPAALEHAMNNANGTVDVENVAGVVLPSTGGMGTTLFYLLGGIMVVGALVILITNKHMRNQ